MEEHKKKWAKLYPVKVMDALIAMIVRIGPWKLSENERSLLLDRCKILEDLCQDNEAPNTPKN